MPEENKIESEVMEKNAGVKATPKERRREAPSNEGSPSVKERKPRAPRKPKVQAEVQEVSKPAQKHEEKPKHEKSHLFAVVMVRGVVGTRRDLKETLMMLRLDRVNHCVVIPKNPNYDGMLHKARHFITWGEVDKETLEKMVAKRGRFAGDKRIKDISYAKELAGLIISGKKVKDTGIKPVFRLSPPSKGYKSTKEMFPRGSLGYRGEKINELIKRMI